jgi:hypothetical protein
VAKYDLLVDGRSRWRAKDEADLRAWISEYREEHSGDDPNAAHIQIRRLGLLAWLTGGTMVDREEFLGS